MRRSPPGTRPPARWSRPVPVSTRPVPAPAASSTWSTSAAPARPAAAAGPTSASTAAGCTGSTPPAGSPTTRWCGPAASCRSTRGSGPARPPPCSTCSARPGTPCAGPARPRRGGCWYWAAGPSGWAPWPCPPPSGSPSDTASTWPATAWSWPSGSGRCRWTRPRVRKRLTSGPVVALTSRPTGWPMRSEGAEKAFSATSRRTSPSSSRGRQPDAICPGEPGADRCSGGSGRRGGGGPAATEEIAGQAKAEGHGPGGRAAHGAEHIPRHQHPGDHATHESEQQGSDYCRPHPAGATNFIVNAHTPANQMVVWRSATALDFDHG